MICPACSADVIEGDEFCEQCHYSLVELSQPAPRSALEQNVIQKTIRSISTKPVLLTPPGKSVGEVVKLLCDHDIGCTVIVEEEKVLGIFSERDVLLKLNVNAPQFRDRPVSEFMTRQVEMLDVDDRIALALHKMDLGGYRHLPVTDNGKLVGLISIRDIMRYMTETILAAG